MEEKTAIKANGAIAFLVMARKAFKNHTMIALLVMAKMETRAKARYHNILFLFFV